MNSIRVIDSNEFGAVGMSKAAKAQFDAQFRRWAKERGQQMPDEMLTVEARYRRRAREEQEMREEKWEDNAKARRKDAPKGKRRRGKGPKK